MLIGQLILVLIGVVFIVCGVLSSVVARIDIDWLVPSLM